MLGGRGGSEWHGQPLALAERFPKRPSVDEAPAFVQTPGAVRARLCWCGDGCGVPVAAMPWRWLRLSVLLGSESSRRRAPLELRAWTKLVESKVLLPERILSPCLPPSLFSSPGRCRQQRILELGPFHM